KAHAYAYGGAIAPDIGYFPFGNPFFTNLVHYVRSGDFVDALLDDARDIDEFAFALGFLSHYMADKYGHSLATNKAVPMLYVKEQERFGNIVTYEEDHLSHKRTEFGFDALQTVEGDYARVAYHDFIGFKISGDLLARAFSRVYGLDIHQVFADFSLSVTMLRWSFKRLFPALTGTAWIFKKRQLKKAHSAPAGNSDNDATKYENYYERFGRKRFGTGIYSRAYTAFFTIFVTFLPKVGPLSVLKFKSPGPDVAKLYYSSFDTTVNNYRAALQACRARTSRLANIDFDTGNVTTPGEYGLADKNYDLLVVKLKKYKFKMLNSELRDNIVDFYSHRTAPTGSRKVQKSWTKTETALQQLREAKDSHAE
ncbi:MAG TPA: zinc dependent phospholipase C family protein, partial [Puia sp.]|nr:zinc dependent phospholipase C family protein [Puia sp.]